MDDAALLDYARHRALPLAGTRGEQHLLIRPRTGPAPGAASDAQLEIAFERGLPVALNGVPMTLPELIDSLSLIAGQHGVGYGDAVPAPAAVILQAAYGAVAAPDGIVRLTLHNGTFDLSQPVNHP